MMAKLTIIYYYSGGGGQFSTLKCDPIYNDGLYFSWFTPRGDPGV